MFQPKPLEIVILMEKCWFFTYILGKMQNKLLFLDKIDRPSMFSSPGDHENMKDGQIWVGIEVLTNKEGSYFYDVHVSGKALGKRSVRIYSQEVDINKCVPQHFKKQIQMTK